MADQTIEFQRVPGLVNVYIVNWKITIFRTSTIAMAIFNSYFDITRGYFSISGSPGAPH